MTARIGAADTPYQQNPRAAAFPARTATARRIQEIPHMEQKQKIERMKALIATLNAAAQAYYQESREMMPNHAYDALYDELEALGSATKCCRSCQRKNTRRRCFP